MLFIFLERGEGREKGRERNLDVREKHRFVASHTCPDQALNLQSGPVPQPGTEPKPLGHTITL